MNSKIPSRTLWMFTIAALLLPIAYAATESHGPYHSLFIENGNVYAMGRNDYGQLGNGNSIDTYERTQVQGLSNVIDVAAGGFHSLALTSDGTLYGWGLNKDKQIADTSDTNYTKPVVLLTGVQGARIEASTAGSLLYKDGAVRFQGTDHENVTGKARSTFKDAPVPESNVQQIRARIAKEKEDAQKAAEQRAVEQRAQQAPQDSTELLQRIMGLEQLIKQLQQQIAAMQAPASNAPLAVNSGGDVVVTLGGTQ